MADETPQRPSEEELRLLPRKALVAYAVRTARRVQPLCVKVWPYNDERNRSLIEAVEHALKLASNFSGGKNVAAEELRNAAYAVDDANTDAAAAAAAAYAAYAAAAATRATAAVGANDATSWAANAAIDANHEDAKLNAACRRDFDLLIARQKEKSAAMKRGVSASERGFLGDLWDGDPPDWYTELKPQLDAILKGKDIDPAQQAKALKEQLAERDQKIASLTEQQQDLQKQLKKLEADRSSTKQELAEKREQLETEVENLKATINQAKKERDSAHKDAAQLESSFETATAQMSVLQEKHQLLQQKYDDTRKVQKETATQLQITENKLEAANSKLANVSGELEETKRQPAGWYWEKFNTPNNWFSLVSLACLVLIVFSVLFWVGEVRGRQKLEQFLTTKIEKLREDLANGAQDSEDECLNRRKLLCEFEQHLGTLQTLTVSGTDHDETTLGEIRNDVFKLVEEGPPDTPTESQPRTPVWTLSQFVFPRYMASDLLLSLVVIMSGAVGAVVAALRATRALGLADLGFGVAAGFITLLAIRGGKNVFMVSNEDVSFYLNPYSSAFVGLLAGLFTDKAYGLLSQFVDKLVKGLVKTFELDKDPPADDTKPEPDGSPKTSPPKDSTGAISNQPPAKTDGDNPSGSTDD